jgi:hypothetical protein
MPATWGIVKNFSFAKATNKFTVDRDIFMPSSLKRLVIATTEVFVESKETIRSLA